jgi:hypothetical protein
MGLPFGSIAVTRQADSLTIGIAKNGACTASSADEPRIKLVLGKLLRFLKSVTVDVAGTQQSLGDYVAARCKRTTIPTAPGQVVFDRGGAGLVTSPPIRIAATRWTVGYDSQASFVQVVAKSTSGGIKPAGFVVRGRGAGLRIFKGPGTFRLQISSPATWSIRVRDGG